MSLLTLDVGGAAMVVRISTAGHREPRQVGTRRYTFFGTERSMIRGELLVVACVLYTAIDTDIRAIRTMFANAAQVPCSGDVFNNSGATVICSGEITDEMEVGGPQWIATLTLSEVGSA